MQFQFQHTAELETHTFQAREVELTTTYQHTPPSRGQTGPHGEPLEPDAESEIEIISVTDEGGNDYEPEEIENAYSLCWDHFENRKQNEKKITRHLLKAKSG